jgi:hypothetical protein
MWLVSSSPPFSSWNLHPLYAALRVCFASGVEDGDSAVVAGGYDLGVGGGSGVAGIFGSHMKGGNAVGVLPVAVAAWSHRQWRQRLLFGV